MRLKSGGHNPNQITLTAAIIMHTINLYVVMTDNFILLYHSNMENQFAFVQIRKVVIKSELRIKYIYLMIHKTKYS